MRHLSARQLIKDRIASRRLIRYYLNIESVILIQTRIRIFLAKKYLTHIKLQYLNAAAIIIQSKFRSYANHIHLKNHSAKLIQKLFICSYLKIPFNPNLSQNIIHNFHNSISNNIHQNSLNHNSSLISNFMKMAAKRHKFKLYLLSQQISARTIQRYIHNWFHHQGSHFLSNHPAVTIISLNNCTNPPNSPISHNNSPNENNTTPSQNIDNTLTSNQENIDRRIINHRIARHQYHLREQQRHRQITEFNDLFRQHLNDINNNFHTTNNDTHPIQRHESSRINALNNAYTEFNNRLQQIRSSYSSNNQPSSTSTTSTNNLSINSNTVQPNNTSINRIHNRFTEIQNNLQNSLPDSLSNTDRNNIIDSLQNPRVRDIYRNNRIIFNGHRLLPNDNGSLTSFPDPPTNSINHSHENDGFRQPTSNLLPLPPIPNNQTVTETFDCVICLESVSVDQKCQLDCNHTFCKTCIGNTIRSALGNISDEIPVRCPLFASSDRCSFIITSDFNLIDQLVSQSDKEKLEKYTLLKQHISPENLRYCPNPSCQLPYEFINPYSNSSPPLFTNSFLNNITCFDCETVICTICNTFAHPGISCSTAQRNNSQENQENNQYIQKYCKHCPHCNSVVQKLQTPEQEDYERTTGLSAGTQECHHMTCSACNQDFCWHCLKGYQSTRYYHRECPTADCVIRFVNNFPHIIGLPPTVFKYVELIIYDNYPNDINNSKTYNLLNSHFLLSIPHDKTYQNTVTLHCNQEGVIKKFNAHSGEFTFKQENKGTFS